jgi:hypothetical protein
MQRHREDEVMDDEVRTGSYRTQAAPKRRLNVAVNKNGMPVNQDSVMAGGPWTGGAYNLLLWDGEHAPEWRSCTDCAWLRGYVSWWCENRRAVDAHGTAIPAKVHCAFWEPCERAAPPLVEHVRMAALRTVSSWQRFVAWVRGWFR